MQESNFEKQVQEKMDELKINPSGEVWQKVAVAIEKRKGDRRIFAIIPLLILCMGSGVFILLNQTTRPNPIKTVSGNANAQKGNGSKNPLTENDSPRSGVVLNMPSGDLTLLNNSSTQKTGKNQPIQLHATGRTAVSLITE